MTTSHSIDATTAQLATSATRTKLWALVLSIGWLGHGVTLAGPERVTLIRTPDGGIQPQAVVDNHGVVHLLYYQGEAKGGDLFYVRREPGKEAFSKPMPVNTQPKSAMAAGTIRGAQLAVGKNGRVHVAWNGPAPSSHVASGRSPVSHSPDGHEAKDHSSKEHGPTGHSSGGHAAGAPEQPGWMRAPMLYTRLNDEGTAFEPERDVITSARGLDGGGSVAADNQGNVYVFWHAPKPGNTNGEAGRALFVARSQDEGRTFAPERLATPKPTGACGCCGMKAFADNAGNVFALYRAASEKVNRDEILLISRNHGADFQIAHAHPWNIATCPMSSASLAAGSQGVLATWETAGQVYLAVADPQTLQVSAPLAPAGVAKRKHPVAVANATGHTLFAWTEGTGWNKGGAVAWQVFDKEGKPTAEKGRADGVPAWSLATAFAKQDGTFVIVY